MGMERHQGKDKYSIIMPFGSNWYGLGEIL
jgi:hypothetical protein